MIEPTDGDVGRKVIYRERGIHADRIIEEGVIIAYNDSYVFVRYEDQVTPKATDRRDLEWMTQ